jgi:uncharacterized protein HemX
MGQLIDCCIAASVLLQLFAVGVAFGAVPGVAALGSYGGIIAVIIQSGATGILAGVLFYLNHQQRKDHKEEKTTLRQERDEMVAALHDFYQKTIASAKKDHREELATGARIIEERFNRVLEEMAEFRNEVQTNLAQVACHAPDHSSRHTEVGGETQIDGGRREGRK